MTQVLLGLVLSCLVVWLLRVPSELLFARTQGGTHELRTPPPTGRLAHVLDAWPLGLHALMPWILLTGWMLHDGVGTASAPLAAALAHLPLALVAVAWSLRVRWPTWAGSFGESADPVLLVLRGARVRLAGCLELVLACGLVAFFVWSSRADALTPPVPRPDRELLHLGGGALALFLWAHVLLGVPLRHRNGHPWSRRAAAAFALGATVFLLGLLGALPGLTTCLVLAAAAMGLLELARAPKPAEASRERQAQEEPAFRGDRHRREWTVVARCVAAWLAVSLFGLVKTHVAPPDTDEAGSLQQLSYVLVGLGVGAAALLWWDRPTPRARLRALGR